MTIPALAAIAVALRIATSKEHRLGDIKVEVEDRGNYFGKLQPSFCLSHDQSYPAAALGGA